MAKAQLPVIDKEHGSLPAYFSIAQLAARWCCSRGHVYNWIRGRKVLHFAVTGRKGRVLVPATTVQEVEEAKMKVWR